MGPLQTTISALTVSVTAFSDITAKQFVTHAGEPAGNGDKVLGVAKADASAGEAVAIDVIGVLDLVSGAAISAGADVQSDANGAPVTLAAGEKIGVALTAAANPGDIVKVLIK